MNNWQLGAITTLAAGRPTTAQIRTTDTPVAGMAYNTSINGFGGNFRVPFWPVNSLYTPPTYRADARISKIIPLGERIRLYLNFEVFNVSNTVVDTSITNQAYLESKRVLTLTPGHTVSGLHRPDSRTGPMPAALRQACAAFSSFTAPTFILWTTAAEWQLAGRGAPHVRPECMTQLRPRPVARPL